MTRWLILCAAWLCLAPAAFAQATSRPCDPNAPKDQPGPACLLAHMPLGALPAGDLYWHLNRFRDEASARAFAPTNGAVVRAFDTWWVFEVGPKRTNGTDTAEIGPLPLTARGGDFAAEILQSTFAPGQTAPVHVHSGPEAFFALTGDTCLESPDGVQTATGPDNHLMIRQGPPMLLMATGTTLRRGFALILHDTTQPPTTLMHDWTPKGLCHL